MTNKETKQKKPLTKKEYERLLTKAAQPISEWQTEKSELQTSESHLSDDCSDDAGTSFFDIQMFIGDRKSGSSAPAGTEHIFNAGTRISGSAKSLSGGNNVDVWVGVQEI